MHFTPAGEFTFVHLWGTATIYADDPMTVPAWECTTNGWIESDWSSVTNVICFGRGENQGLKATLTLTFPDPDWNYDLTGEILDPGH